MVNLPSTKKSLKSIGIDLGDKPSRGCIVTKNWKGEITDIIYDDDSRYRLAVYRMTTTAL